MDLAKLVLQESSELKNSELVKDVVKFLTEDKKRPICSPFSKQ